MRIFSYETTWFNRFLFSGFFGVMNIAGFIVLMIAVVQTYSYQASSLNALLNTTPPALMQHPLGYPGVLFFACSASGAFLLGIEMLIKLKGAKAHNLAIAAALLCLLGSLVGINTIVSFIGAAKEYKLAYEEKEHQGGQYQDQPWPQNPQYQNQQYQQNPQYQQNQPWPQNYQTQPWPQNPEQQQQNQQKPQSQQETKNPVSQPDNQGLESFESGEGMEK